MNRSEKIQALKIVFETGNKAHLEGVNDMVIHSVVIERGGWLQIIQINPAFPVPVPVNELTLNEFQEWKGSIPLFPDLT